MFELRMYSCCCRFFLCMFVSGFSVRLCVCVCVCVCVFVFFVGGFCVIVFFLLFIFDVVNCRYQKCCCLFRGFFRVFLKSFLRFFMFTAEATPRPTELTASHYINKAKRNS